MPEELTGTEARAKIQAEARRRLAELQEQEKAKNDELAKAMKDAEVHSVAHVSYRADHVGLCDVSAQVAWTFAATPVESRSGSHTSGPDPDAARAEPFEEAVRKEFSRLQAEEDERRGDDGVGEDDVGSEVFVTDGGSLVGRGSEGWRMANGGWQ